MTHHLKDLGEMEKMQNTLKGQTMRYYTFMSMKCVVYDANYRVWLQFSKIQVVP